MWLNQMQEALVKAAVAKGTGKVVNKVAKAADRIKVEDPKSNIKLSFKTAQKLKQQGVLV